MKKDVSIVIPSIRPQNLIKVYNAAAIACKRHTFELVIPSPYLIPEELMRTGNVKFLHTYQNPTIAFQIAALLCDAEYIYNTTDDGLIQEDVIDLAIDMFQDLNKYDAINMMYDEGVLDPDTLELLNPNHNHFSDQYWFARSHGDLRLPGISDKWKLCIHAFMNLDYFYELGGFDCEYEYLNHPIHDLAFRIQAYGGKIVNSPKTALYCSHLPGHLGDHGPVNDAQLGPDLIRFNSIYSDPQAITSRIILNYDHWKNKPSIWTRRFKTSPLPLKPNE